MADTFTRSSALSPADAVGEADDVGELYRALSARLEQIVRRDVRAPDQVIEDSCQFAWSRLLVHAHRVRRDAALSWLARTAVHEALKLLRREDRESSLDAALEQTGDSIFRSPDAGPVELLEYRERLDRIGRLTPRQQRLVWQRAVGLSYSEMAVRERCSTRTVERQLLRAASRMRADAAAI